MFHVKSQDLRALDAIHYGTSSHDSNILLFKRTFLFNTEYVEHKRTQELTTGLLRNTYFTTFACYMSTVGFLILLVWVHTCMNPN